MSWFNDWVKKYSPEPSFTGAILPSPADLATLSHFDDIVATAAEVVWKPLTIANLPTWPQYDQNQEFSCVANTKALMKTNNYYLRRGVEIKFSPVWLYNLRKNKPTAGMIGTDAFTIDKNIGQIPYDLLPSPASEAAANAPKTYPEFYDIAKVFQSGDPEPIIVPVKNIETLASIQQVTGKPIMVWFEFEWSEWAKFVPTVEYINPSLRHSVTFVPKRNPTDVTFGIYNGEKAIVIQDSTGLTSTIDGKRIITESFFKSRNIFAAYDMKFRFEVSDKSLVWDGTIVSLQKCLQSKGYFPMNVAFIENYGPTTRASVIKFQAAQNIPQTGLLDSVTKTELHQVF